MRAPPERDMIRSKQYFSFGLKKIEVKLVGRNRWRLVDRLVLWALGVVHAWVGRKHLNCYIFKCFTRKTL
jgi:hypothetical protein